MANRSFRVWKLRARDAAPQGTAPFCVDAPTHEAAASQIAMELSMGGFYCVDLPPSERRAGDARIIRIVPVTTYEAVSIDDGGKRDE